MIRCQCSFLTLILAPQVVAILFTSPPPRQPALTAHTLMRQSELSPATTRPLVLPGGVRNRITICHLVSINHYNPMRTSGFLRRHLMKQIGTTSPGVGGLFMDLFFFYWRIDTDLQSNASLRNKCASTWTNGAAVLHPGVF